MTLVMFASSEELASIIDHTRLKADTSEQDIRNLCREAVQYGFHAVCIPPYFLAEAGKALKKSSVKLCTVVGFPYGWQTKYSKQFEALEGLKNGAAELDIVMNVAAVKSGNYKDAKAELKEVMERTRECLHKVIIEISLLDEKELNKVIDMMNDLKPAFVKTSTGAYGPATPEEVVLLRKTLQSGIGIKAAGGIRTYETVKRMREAGAARIGTSTGVRIIEEYLASENK